MADDREAADIKMDKLQSQFSEILDLIKDAQYQVVTTTNQSLIQLYWAIGQAISNRLKNSEWGKKTIEQLASFIQSQRPGLKGFEKHNLERMRQFYETYPGDEITTALRSQLSWTHHRIIMSRCKTPMEREFYLQLASAERYSTRELERQINCGVFERTSLADVKRSALGRPQSVDGVFRDSYILGFCWVLLTRHPTYAMI